MSFRSISQITLSLFCLFIVLPASAESLSKMDSVGVERVGDQSFILHEVEPKETLFGIGRKYQAVVGDIINANESLKGGLKIGQTIRVPFIPAEAIPAGSKLHKVTAGETLFSISKKYEVTVEEIKDWNNLLGNDLSIGQGLLIKESQAVAEAAPEPEPIVEATATATVTSAAVAEPQAKAVDEKPSGTEIEMQSSTDEEMEKKEKVEKTIAKMEEAAEPVVVKNPMVQGDWTVHTVESDETLFSIASLYDARVEDLITWNALSSNNLSEGQVIRVGRGPLEESKVPVYGGSARVVSSTDEAMNVSATTASSGGFKNIKETGQAELIEGTGSHKKYLVLHRTAPIGTIMRVKNEENDVTIFARVVGALPETGDNDKLVIKLSQAAFDQLKAVNARFPVEVMY